MLYAIKIIDCHLDEQQLSSRWQPFIRGYVLRLLYASTFYAYDNSASARAIRPFCVGRANWHVIDSIKGAQASAIVYSIIETAKANDLKPYECLKHLLSVMT